MPSLISLTETWLSDNIPDSIFGSLQRGYSIFRKDRPDGFGGVAILCSNNFKCHVINLPATDTDSVFIKIFLNNNTSLIYGVIYRPPNNSNYITNPNVYYETIISNLNFILSFNLPLILTGDFNFSSINWSLMYSPICKSLDSKFCKYLLNNGLFQFVSQATHIKGNLIDLVIGSEKFIVVDCNVLNYPFLNSDHLPVQFSINIKNNITNNIPRYNFFKADYESLNHFFFSYDWVSLFSNCFDSNVRLNLFMSVVNDAISKFVPLKLIRKTKFGFHLDKTARRSIITTKAMYRQLKRRRTDANLIKYRKAATISRCKIRKCLYECESNILKSNNVKKFYNYINSKFKSKPCIDTIVNSDDILITDDFGKAEEFNNYFSSVFSIDNGLSPNFPPRSVHTIEFINFDVDTVFNALNSINESLPAGPDGLPGIFLKKCSLSLAFPILLLFQWFFYSHDLPDLWKLANIIPIFKKLGSKNCLSNFRPISCLCILNNIFERLIVKQILSFFKAFNIFSFSQHGFLPKRSVETAMLNACKYWFDALSTGDNVDIVFLDISKAFDKVSHSKLLLKLEAYGICGDLLLFFKSYLSNRKQRVCINNVYSSECSILSGVPQGSVMGPFMFILYVNDLIDVIKNSHLIQFADDSKISFRFKTINQISLFHEDLQRIFDWFSSWQLPVNFTKSNLLHLGKNNPNINFSINNVNLNIVNEVKDLGILINSNLSFSTHCIKISSTARYRFAMIYRCFLCRDLKFLVNMFKTYCRPLLEFSTTVWSPMFFKDIDCIESVQRAFTKRIPGFKDLDYVTRLKKCNLEPLSYRRLVNDLIMVYKIFNKLVDINFDDYFQLNNYVTTRGNGLKLFIIRSNNRLSSHFFCNRIVKCWNLLPNDVIMSNSVNSFKKKLYSDNIEYFLCINHNFLLGRVFNVNCWPHS